MGKIINSNELQEHHVKKFNFATLEVDEKKTSFDKNVFSDTQESEPEAQKETPQEPSQSEELLSKVEALSSENITLQMSLETMQKESDDKLQEAKELAHQEGKEEGIKETQTTHQEHQDELKMQLVKSITLLEEQLVAQKTLLDTIEAELTQSAIMIAKKVIKKELDEHSKEIAKTLAKDFLSTFKDASQITLKVNPQDASYIQEHLQENKSIMIDADDAIQKGGVVILSDIGNIDGTIQTRIEKAIALIDQEG
jgi:flagellar assembly protein FliH